MNDIQLAYLENMVTTICACLAAYFIDPWCFLLLLNLNNIRTIVTRTKNVDS